MIVSPSLGPRIQLGGVAKGVKSPLGLPVWQIKALFEFAVEKGTKQDEETLDKVVAEFEHPNTPQEILETYAWRCGSKSTGSSAESEDTDDSSDSQFEDCPLLYGTTRHAVWYGGHRMVVETVSGDPRVAFVHNLVTVEEVESISGGGRKYLSFSIFHLYLY